MKWSKSICERVNPDIKDKAITLAEAVEAMQKKIKQQLPVYKDAELAQQVTLGTGETVARSNPTVQEFRATVRDYAQALNSLQDIIENNQDAKSEEMKSLDYFRSRIRKVQ